MGFYLRAGLWIDGLQILTSLGRRSEIFGNPIGGSGYVQAEYFYFLKNYKKLTDVANRHTLIPPRGYTVAGISGSCAQWLDGFSLIITR